MKAFKLIVVLISLVFLQISAGMAQQSNAVLSVDMIQSPDEYAIMYVSDLINNPASAPIIFQFSLSPKVTDPEISIEADFTADVPDLNLNNEQIFSVRTNPFVLSGRVTISNRDLADQSNVVTTDNGHQITITASGDNIQYIQGARQNDLISQVLGMPTVPSGVYTFHYSIYSEDGQFSTPLSDVISVEFQGKPSIQLVAPSPVDDATIQTTYPVFQWESSGASRDCYYGIRVCEFNPQQHSSPEEALNDDANFPFPDNGGYVKLHVTGNTFQYPLTGAKELDEGKQYVWQMQKYCPSTRGEEVVESEIAKFTISSAAVDPVKIALETILGQDLYTQYFDNNGQLAGFEADQSTIKLDDHLMLLSELMSLSTQFSTGKSHIVNTQIQE